VHEGEAPFGCSQRILERGEEDQVFSQPLHDPLHGKLHQQRGAGCACLLQGRLNHLERHEGGLLSGGDGLEQAFPVTVQDDREEIVPPRADTDASLPASQPLAVTAQAPEDQGQTARIAVAVAHVEKALIDLPEINHQILLTIHIRRALLKNGKEIPLHPAKSLQQLFRAVFDLVTDKGRKDGLLGEQALSGHILQGSQHPLGLGLQVGIGAGAGKGAQGGQIIGAEASVGRDLHQGCEDIQPALPLPPGEAKGLDLFARLLKSANQRFALKNTGIILVPVEEAASLQP